LIIINCPKRDKKKINMKRIVIFTVVLFSAISMAKAQEQRPTITANGVKADEPTAVFKMFLEIYEEGGDYKALCNAKIDLEQVEAAVAEYKEKRRSRTLIAGPFPSPDETYTKLKGKNISFPENYYLFQIITIDNSDRNNPIMELGIYVVLSHDSKNGTYWIEELFSTEK